MNKKFSIPALLLMSAVMAAPLQTLAEEVLPKAFVVYTKGGEKVSLPIAEAPVLTHNGTVLVINSETAHLEYNPADVDRFTIEDYTYTGIGETIADASAVIDDDTVTVSGLTAGCPVDVYTLAGIRVFAGKADSDGRVSVDITPLPSGTLILKFNNSSVKIIKK